MNYKKEEILHDILIGKPIIITDDQDRENEGDFFVAAEKATKESILMMLNEGRGLICTPLSKNIAERLKLEPMVMKNSSSHETAFTVSVDHKSNSTGISLHDRLQTIINLSKSSSSPDEFLRPGHIFPLIANSGGLRERRGHTEAAVELSRLAGLSEVGVICEILNKDGSIAKTDDLNILAKKYSLKIISIQDILNLLDDDVFHVNMPTRYGEFKMHHFKGLDSDFTVMSYGDLETRSPLLRIHSECFTGDVFGSLRCDCGAQLDQSMKLISLSKGGIIVYLKQEGRGIGLRNKLKAYQLQEKGLDTFEANNKLGFEDDLRQYNDVKKVLDYFGIKSVKLISNNPDKIKFLENIEVNIEERVDLNILPNQKNYKYFIAKKNKKNHFLNTKVL